MSAHKMSLWLAIVVNINIVTGGAFFLASAQVAQQVGVWAPLAWILVGLCLMPLTLTLAELARRYPHAGGLYVYAQQTLGNLYGFIAGWGYYIGTAAGNAVMLHAFVTRSGIANYVTLHPHADFNIWLLDASMLAIFSVINFYNIEALRVMQVVLTTVKIIPVAMVLIALPFAGKISNFVAGTGDITQLWGTVPLILFAYVGIEACCAISHSIEDGKRNAGRALMISFSIIIGLYALLQAALIALHGTVAHPDNPFNAVVPLLFADPTWCAIGSLVINAALLCSYLGGFYSMFYANNWNLVAMGYEKALPASGLLTRMNVHGAPWIAILIQAGVMGVLLKVTGDLPRLMTMSDFGAVIAYLLSACAFIYVSRNNLRAVAVQGTLALAGAGAFLWFCVRNLIHDGVTHIIPFAAILALGLGAYLFSACIKKN